MKLLSCLLFCFLCSMGIEAQINNSVNEADRDSLLPKPPRQRKSNSPDDVSLTGRDYKIISLENDTTYIDTTLTIKKEYSYNYLRKDDFELLPFSNLGQTYNALSLNLNEKDIYPGIGARAKHYNYMRADEINYYHVPTPMTDLLFKTTMEQGQLLDAFLTLNTSERLNFSIAYKGMRSLGKYQHILSSTGNFRFTANYTTPKGRYHLKTHFVSQDIFNEENGGIINRDQFESGDDQFTDRSRIDVLFQDAENLLIGKRYFVDHIYYLARRKDSLRNSSLGLHHRFAYETKRYEFDQSSANDYFGEAFLSGVVADRTRLKTMYNSLGLQFSNSVLGQLMAGVSHYNYNYFFDSVLITPEQTIQNKLEGDELALIGSWQKRIGGFGLDAGISMNFSGDLGGEQMFAGLSYQLKNGFDVGVKAFRNVRSPNFNFLLYQSDYKNYNWQHTESFQKEENLGMRVMVNLKKWGSVELDYTTLDNFTYFRSLSSGGIKPSQHEYVLNYTKLKYQNNISLGKFSLENTVMYQHVSQGRDILNVPEIITRNTLYYSNDVFKKAMFLQTGITFKYFTSYYANAYDPLLGEFYSQSDEKIGGFPLFDFFVNARVRQTRIYLKAEHFNSSFTGYDFYAAPNYPYRDFVVRFGLVWNFFR